MNEDTEKLIKQLGADSYQRGWRDGYAKAKQDMSSTTVYNFNCEVCFVPVDDMEQHYLRYENEPSHKAYIADLRASGWKKPCLCGGHISTFGINEGWETVCDDCKILWDED